MTKKKKNVYYPSHLPDSAQVRDVIEHFNRSTLAGIVELHSG